MADLVATKNFLRKIQKIVNFEAVFTHGNYKFVNKIKIDDIMCCILATLPDSYKKMLKTKKDIQRYNSVSSLGGLTELFARRFFLNKKLCIVNAIEANTLIDLIIGSIDNDVEAIAQQYN